MAEAYAYTTGTISTKLLVQTYDFNFGPLKLASVDTVNSSSTGLVTAQIADVSVASNPGFVKIGKDYQIGSFAVFWTDDTTTDVVSGGIVVSNSSKYVSYEQGYSAKGTAGAKHILNQGTLSNTNFGSPPPPNAGDMNSKGGMAFAFTTLAGLSDTLSVQTYDFNFQPLQLVNVDTVNSSSTGLVTAQIADVSVTSNPDGSFAVFWTDDTTTDVVSNGIVVSNSSKYVSYEQGYSANGAAGAKHTLNQGTLSNTNFGSPPPPNAGDVNSKGGMAFAFTTLAGLSDTLSVQTYDSNFQPLQLVNVDTVNSSSTGLVTAQIGDVSVTSNWDGSFTVFWTDDTTTDVVSNGIVVSNSSKYVSYEQGYSANGTAGAKHTLNKGTLSNTNFGSPPPPNAGDAGTYDGIDYRYKNTPMGADPIWRVP